MDFPNTSIQYENIHVFRFYKPVLVVNFKIMITKVLLLLWIFIIMFYFVTGDGKGKELKIALSLIYFFVDIVPTSCHHLRVNFPEYSWCNGEYAISNKYVRWAPDKPVYKHLHKNRWGLEKTYYVFYCLNCKGDILEC